MGNFGDGNTTSTGVTGVLVLSSTEQAFQLSNPFAFNFTVTGTNGCVSTSTDVSVTVVTCGAGITLTDTVFIEGYSVGSRDGYGSTGGYMDNGGAGGLLYMQSVPGATITDVDTIRVSLMDATTFAPVATALGILQTNGVLVTTFPTATPGSYYIKLVHRNALESWSAAPVTMGGSTASYNFSSAANKAYGDNQTEVSPGVWAIYSGDISDVNITGLGLGYQDGVVESQDYADMEAANAVNSGGYIPEDITGDGVTESTDYAIMEGNNAVNRGVQRPF